MAEDPDGGVRKSQQTALINVRKSQRLFKSNSFAISAQMFLLDSLDCRIAYSTMTNDGQWESYAADGSACVTLLYNYIPYKLQMYSVSVSDAATCCF